jgi:long-chain acyl-CoA synthetase
MVSLVSFLDENARRQPDHLACVVGDDSLSYAELRDASCRFAGALTSLGLQPGDRISLYMPNSAAYVACYLAVMRAGMIANPVNGVLTPHEVGYMLADSGAAALVSTRVLADGLAGVLAQTPVQHVIGLDTLDELPASPFGSMSYPDDLETACLPYSSGTTGRPKGIMHSHHSLGMQALLSANHLQMRPEDVLVQALPLVHLYPGNIIMGGLFTVGATMVVQPVRDAYVFMTAHDKQRFVEQADYPARGPTGRRT